MPARVPARVVASLMSGDDAVPQDDDITMEGPMESKAKLFGDPGGPVPRASRLLAVTPEPLLGTQEGPVPRVGPPGNTVCMVKRTDDGRFDPVGTVS